MCRLHIDNLHNHTNKQTKILWSYLGKCIKCVYIIDRTFLSLTETQTCHTHMHTYIQKYHNIKTQNPELISWKYLLYKNTYGTIQSYTTSAHILRYQAFDPKLEEDVVKPVSTPTINFRGEKNTHFHGCDWSCVLPDQSQTSENHDFV